MKRLDRCRDGGDGESSGDSIGDSSDEVESGGSGRE